MMFLYIYIILLLKVPAVVLGVTLDQGPKVVVKGVGKTIYLQCKADGLSGSDYIHWYQVKDKEAPTRLLYISKGGSVARDTSTEGAADFTVDKTKLYDLKLSNTQPKHSAVYFCAYWDTSMGYWIKRFGPGTRLIVTGKTESPKVSGYLPSKKYSDKDGNQTMLCHARDMIPDLVKFTWQKMSRTKEWEDVKENVVEQSYKVKENNQVKVKAVTSMMIIDKNTAENNDYQCIVTHEGVNEKPQILLMKKDEIKPTMVSKKQDCPPTDETIKNQISGDSEQIRSLYMFVYAYGVMIMKNVMYFCVVTIFLLKRKAARKKDESS
ncbi:uncharacterized protein LOC132154845 isoform X3 [Carassius carassius]|uniref:uncharacterized protein LOC132154845 isoform X3 n=1 Tax=Carassius carassius TaxID=217509 RepID=UPI0028691E23|nr:uncharacterized protein LOC132154845 isoform X3 [Carassius carassius]